jgi:nucleotide-binding universal stress UspA family protein
LLAALDRSAEVIAAGARRALSRRWPGADVTIVDATPVDGILREAQRLRADVIVLGWSGHGTVRRLLMGSVSRGVVRGATCGILLVRGRPRDVRRVVVGFDGSANAKRAVGFVGTLRPPPGGQVTLITTVDRPAVPSQALALGGVRAAVAAEVKRLNVQRVARAKKELARAAATLTPAGWRVRTVVTSGDPLRDLLAAVNSAGADLIVIGARGVSGMRHLLLGSVAEGALNRSPVPILVVR